MDSFDLDVSEKDLAGAEHIMRVGRYLAAAFIRKCKAEKLTKQQIAERLDIDKSTVSRMLRGDANLTLRSVGELCWALDLEPEFRCRNLASERSNVPVHAQWSISESASVSKSGFIILSAGKAGGNQQQSPKAKVIAA